MNTSPADASVTFNITMRSFYSKVMYFNGMYKLPIAPYPTLRTEAAYQQERTGSSNAGPQHIIQRLKDFRKILSDEITEVDDIIAKIESDGVAEIDILTDIADWLNDIIVYCTSEGIRFGIPMTQVQDIIMASNFSKLGADGKPIYDERGKVMKGPHYWKPEPQIKALLLETIQDHTGAPDESKRLSQGDSQGST